MATLENKRKLAAMARETHEYPSNSRSQNSSAPGISEEYMAQVSEEIEGRFRRNYPRSSAGQNPAFWVPCPSSTNFS